MTLKMAFILDNGITFFLSEGAKVVMVNDRFKTKYDSRLIVTGMDAYGNGKKQRDGTYLVDYLELRVEMENNDSRSEA